jgi:hypothetical protein
MVCDVRQGSGGLPTAMLRYRTSFHDPIHRSAEALAVMNEVAPHADRAGVRGMALVASFRAWTLEPGSWPALRRDAVESYFFVRCDDGGWAATCARLFRGDALARDAGVLFCGPGGPFTLPH